MGRVFGAAAAVAVALACATPAAWAAPAHHRHHHHHRSAHHRLRPQVGKASYYGVHQAGRTTASGKPLKPKRLTAASKSLPLGTKAKVTNLHTGRSVKVTVTDRGPYRRGRIVDVSPKAAKRLGMKHDGVAEVKVTPLKLPSESR